MEPIEKAKSLVKKFWMGNKNSQNSYRVAIENVKIISDEMIAEFTNCYSSEPDDLNALRLSFWMDVKQELENL